MVVAETRDGDVSILRLMVVAADIRKTKTRMVLPQDVSLTKEDVEALCSRLRLALGDSTEGVAMPLRHGVVLRGCEWFQRLMTSPHLTSPGWFSWDR